MTENNYIFRIIKGENVESRELKRQREEYLDFIKFAEEERNKDLAPVINVIEFKSYEADKTAGLKLPVKYAADSGESTTDFAYKKSNFLTSNDGNFAIKYSKKINEEIHLTVLSDGEEYTGDIILYSEIIGKYFVSNMNGEFIIGQYFNFDLNKFNFKALIPFETVVLFSAENNFSAIPVNKLVNPEVEEITDINIRLKINSQKEFSNAVLKSRETKDFLKTDGIHVEIPRFLLVEKAELFLY